MTQFMSKSFSVSLNLGEEGRKNYDRIFKPRKRRKGEKDDTARIQEAVDNASKAGGGAVAIPPGEYRVNVRAIRLPKPKKAAK